MADASLGVGIIGAGAFGRQHAEAIARLSDARLVAVSVRTRARLDAFTREHGGAGYSNYHELLRDPAVDVVCIALPHNDHAEAAIAAAEAGKAILLEKPMAPTVADCDAIIRLLTDDELAARLGDAGQERVRSSFSIGELVNQNQAFYQSCVREFGRLARTAP